ncbi:acyl carrier protein [Lacibacterium aquatile]|uniref:Acyl carrier protein n=1 Tax=Lacibacterium aquatile TaxID=1168082 RepID=A0ABW5DVB5_9PROT
MAEVKNWMELNRAIVKLIRDQYGIDEAKLTRTAVLESDLGLNLEQVEQILEMITETFEVKFPDGTLDEVLRLEELCLLSSWMRGLYKQPPFVSEGFAASCRSINPGATAA